MKVNGKELTLHEAAGLIRTITLIVGFIVGIAFFVFKSDATRDLAEQNSAILKETKERLQSEKYLDTEQRAIMQEVLKNMERQNVVAQGLIDVQVQHGRELSNHGARITNLENE